MDNRAYVQGRDYFLSGSGITSAATTITLTSMKYPDGTTNIVTADFGAKGYAVLEPETDREENISFTTITQNADGTATITGVTRGLRFKTPYTADATLQVAHAGGTKFRISNTVPFYNDFANKENNETLSQVWTFATGATPVITDAPVGVADAANKAYVDGVAIAGAPNMGLVTNGIAEEASTAEIDANTQAGGTGAELAVNPFYLSTSKYGVPNNGTLSSSNKYVSQLGLQRAQEIYAASASGNDTYAVTLSPVPAGYVNGMVVNFKPDTANTGAATLNVNALGAIDLQTPGGTALSTGDILANQIVTAVYNSTGPKFQMQSRIGTAPTNLFGGNGADGALTVAAGTTNIALDAIFNYTTVSIAGGATLSTAGTDGCMYIKTTGNFTNAGTLSLVGKGEAGGAGNITFRAGNGDQKDAGDQGTNIAGIPVRQDSIFAYASATIGTPTLLRSGGRGGASGVTSGSPSGVAQGGSGGASLVANGVASAGLSSGFTSSAFTLQHPAETATLILSILSRAPYSQISTPTLQWFYQGVLPFGTGAGGGGGGGSVSGTVGNPTMTATAGNGGRGGGGLYIECRGSFDATGGTQNLTGAIGVAAAATTTGGTCAVSSGGGGGGGSGCGVVLANTIAAQGTNTVDGGVAGAGATASGGGGTPNGIAGGDGGAGAVTFILNTLRP